MIRYMNQTAQPTGNMVTLGEDGVIRHILVGDQTRRDIIDLRVVTLPLIDQLRDSGKSVLLLIDVSRIKHTTSEVRIEARKMLEVDFDRMAIIGNSYLQPIITFILQTVGKGDSVRYFVRSKDAEQWLHHPTASAKGLRGGLQKIGLSSWITLIALVLLLFSTVSSGQGASKRIDEHSRAIFTTETDKMMSTLDSRMSNYLDALYAFRGLFRSSQSVSEKEFNTFFTSLNLAEHYPGFYSIRSVTKVTRAEKAAFVQAIRADTSLQPEGDQDFTISPPGDRDEYFVITHATQQDAGIKGIDLALNQARAPALLRARDTGDPQATPSINLLDAQGNESTTRGFLLTVPIYSSDVLNTVEDRQAHLQGFIETNFDYKVLLKDTLQNTVPEKLHITIFDSDDHLIYEQGQAIKKANTLERSFRISGQTWRVIISAPVDFGIDSSERRLPSTVYSFGIVLSLLLLILFWVQIRARQRTVQLAGTMTEDLRNERNEAIATHNKDEAILSSIGDAVFAIDQADKIILFNRMAEMLSGVKAADAIGKRYRDILEFQDSEGNVRDDFINRAQAGKRAEMGRDTTLVRLDGQTVPVADSAAPIFDAEGGQRGVIVVFRDVSEQKMFEEVLQQSNERFKLAAKATSDVVYDLTVATGGMQWNDSLCSVYGYSDKDRSSTIEWWTRHIHPEDTMRVNEAFDQLTNRLKSNWEIEYRFQKADQSYVFVRDRAFVLRDKDGEPVRVIGSMLDITKQKELDRAKDEFISLVSHQLRTPLTAIRLFTEMLAGGQVGSLQDQQKDYIDKIATSTKRMIDLVGDILNVSRVEMGRIKIEPVLSDPAAVIKSQLDEIKPIADKKKITIMSDLQATPKINLDPLLFGQIVHNLLTNAIRYTNDSQGQIKIGFYKISKGYELAVGDNGIGIPPEAQSRIFQRFFRADNAMKVEGEGTGLGLYLIKLITEASGGSVRFKSEIGKGTTFYVTLPPEGMKPKKGEKSFT